MDDGDSETVEDWASQLPDSLVGVSLVDAPVLFLVVSHKAFRAELASLRRAALEAAEVGVYSRELVVDLSRRLEFFKLVYNYHSAAEDEVIFLALDAQVKNVAPTYSLEHKSIDDNFNSVFHHFDLLMNRDEDAHIFQELLFSIGTLQAMICQHMQKEEEQVFPLLRKKFTSEEQSQFVWQYMCSVPIILLEDFFPWMTSYLSSDERLDVIHCLKLILPKERLIQEAVVSWIQHKDISSSDGCNVYIKGSQFLKEVSISKDLVKLYPHYEHEHEFKESGQVHTNGVEGPVKGIHLWHAALRREFNQIIEELNQISSSECFLSLSSVIAHIKFVADVMIFYSNSLDTIISPLLNQLAKNSPSPCSQLVDENGIKSLQRLLSYKHECSSQLRSFVEMLCEELEALEKEFSKTLITLETEVFPFISNNCTLEMQLWLLYTNLHVMPLGLLRCTITWFSAHLSESQSNSILKNMRVGCPATPKSFTSLLYEWVRIACSGKSSSAKFRQNLEEMFNGRSFYLPKDVFFDDLIKPNLAIEMKKSAVIPSSSVPVMIEERGNLDKFFSQMFKRIPPYQKNVAKLNSASLESRPMDFVRYIHRALIKDLEYLVSLSAKLATNVGFLVEFKKRLKLLQDIYQIHSKSEDEIIFPALETKVAIQNVSHSYCIDHKLEVKQFKRTSRILDKISELHDKESNDTKLKHRQLCLKLHDTCLSMHKVLSDHICREEIEIFPSFQKCFSIEEEENVVGHMLGRTRAEILQQMMPWLMGYLTSDEQNAVMSLWFKVSRYTNFTDWLGEWWEDMTTYNTSKVEEGSKPSPLLVVDPMVVISDYLQKNGIKLKIQEAGYDRGIKEETVGTCIVNEGTLTVGKDGCQSQESDQYPSEDEKKRSTEINDRCHNDEAADQGKESQKVSHEEHPLCLNQEELEATIRRVSSDSTLDSQKKSYIIQNLLMSRWIVSQKISHQEAVVANDKGKIPDQNPSYRDPLKLTFGCKHYKRNCKLFAPCCNELYTCIRCHDEFTDHAVDRKAITKMMCMKCLEIQSIGPNCTNHSCRGFSMARYYCRTCKLFDDERQIYHCPYCNLCRLGKGLGIDYFHCMKCNACMSKSLFIHICREKCLEDNCPICHEYIFTSSSPVKALPCGHLMHSTCFQDYTCSHYICPICSKSLGDMQVYFGMLDALLAEEKMPEEYSDQIQVILCNDCEKRGTASFHWLYHKCPHCGSYNTRIM